MVSREKRRMVVQGGKLKMGTILQQYLDDAHRESAAYIKENLRLQAEVENLREQERWLVRRIRELERLLER